MSVTELLNNPSWSAFSVWSWTGTLEICVAIAAIVQLWPASEQHAVKSLEDGTDSPLAASPHSTAIGYTSDSLRPTKGRFNGMVVVAAVAAALALLSLTVAVRHYSILTSWGEGHSSEFIGDNVGAIIAYKKALRVDPDLRHTHFLIGRSLLHSNRAGSALPELVLGSSGEMADPQPWAELGNALLALDRSPEAVAAFRQAVLREPDNPQYLLRIGDAEERTGRPDLAYNRFHDAIQLDPNSPTGYLRKGNLLLRLGHHEESIACCSKAVLLSPNDPAAHTLLGAALADDGRMVEAVNEYQTAVNLKQNFLPARYDLAVALKKLNQPKLELETLKSCMQSTPTSDDDSAILQRVREEIKRVGRHI